MADVITRLKVESSEYDAKIKRAAQSLSEMSHQAEIEGNKIALANKENLALAKSLGNMQTVATSARGKMAEFSQAIESATLMYNRLSQAEKQGQFGKALNASINQLQGRLVGLKNEMAAVNAQMSGVGKMAPMASAGGGLGASIMKGASGALSSLGPAALAASGVTATLSAYKKIIGDIISVNMNFEQSSAGLAAVLGVTRDDVAALTNQAKQLGATTQYTAVQILELQTNLARLGFTQQEILNSTTSVQALATATGADLGDAANLAGAALRGFGLNATEMDRVASVLAVSTTKSALSFEKLATAVPIVAPVAKQFGFTIEDTVTLLGKLSDAGMDASSAATATRNIFLNMADSSGKLAKALGRPIKSMDDFVPAMQELRDKGIDLNDMLELTDKRSVTAFATFMEGVDTLYDLRDAITDCSDAMQDMQDKQLDTLQGSLTLLSSAWDGLMMSFSESVGPIKTVVDWLTKAINLYTGWRSKYRGTTDSAVSAYERGVTAEDKQANATLIQAYRAGGSTDEQIINIVNSEVDQLEAQKNQLLERVERIRNAMPEAAQKAMDIMGMIPGWGMVNDAIIDTVTPELNGLQNLYQEIAALNDQIAAKSALITSVTQSPQVTDVVAGEDGNGNRNGNAGANNYLSRRKAEIEAEIQLEISKLDRMHMAEEEYEASVYEIKRTRLQMIADLYQDETTEKARAMAAISSLDIQYQGIQMRIANKLKRDNREGVVIPLTFSEEGINNLGKQIKSAMSKLEFGSADYLIAAENLVDFNTLQTLLNVALKNGLSIDQEWFNSLFEDVKMNAYVDPATWQAAIDEINRLLAEKGIDPIKINLDTGSLDDAKTKVVETVDVLKESLDNLSSGVGAISTLGNAFNDLKNIGDDLASAFNGEMDAWDSLMTVFNSGIGIMQTVIGVMEAINTLQQLSVALSDQKKEKQLEETTTVVAGKMAESTANMQEAGTAMTSAGANAAESSSAAGKAVAGIPIVGPILAVAAIAAVLAATFAAMSKAKSAGNFSTGGIVPGNSYSGDNLSIGVNSQELVLNRAQTSNLASQLQNNNPFGGLALSMELKGEDIQICLDNNRMRRGR